MVTPPKIRGFDLCREKACIFTRKAELMWSSPAWWPDGKPGPEEARFLGFGWHEFVYNEDLDQMLADFASPTVVIVKFRCMLPPFGCYGLFTHYKMALGEYWLTIGDFVPTDVVLPTMPCDFYLPNERTG